MEQNSLLRQWAEAVTADDRNAARTALRSGACKYIKLEKMDAKEQEVYNRVSRDIEIKLSVLKKGDEGYDLAYSLDSSRARVGSNLVSIGLCKSAIVLNEGDTVTATVAEVRPILKGGLYGCTVSGAKILYKADGDPNSSREIIGAADKNGSLVCEPAMRKAIEKFNLEHSMNHYQSKTVREATFFKTDDEKRLVYCVIFEPSSGAVKDRDTDGQWADANSIEDSAHWFMAYGNSHSIKLNHKEQLSEANVMVESYIAPVAFESNGQLIKAGSWIGVWFVGDDEDWNNWKNGIYTGVSLEGPGLIQPDAPGIKPQDVTY